jgi:hypothetical protein
MGHATPCFLRSELQTSGKFDTAEVARYPLRTYDTTLVFCQGRIVWRHAAGHVASVYQGTSSKGSTAERETAIVNQCTQLWISAHHVADVGSHLAALCIVEPIVMPDERRGG